MSKHVVKTWKHGGGDFVIAWFVIWYMLYGRKRRLIDSRQSTQFCLQSWTAEQRISKPKSMNLGKMINARITSKHGEEQHHVFWKGHGLLFLTGKTADQSVIWIPNFWFHALRKECFVVCEAHVATFVYSSWIFWS